MMSVKPLSRAWSDEEQISLNYVNTTLPLTYLEQAGLPQFLAEFNAWPERTLRLEAVHQTLIAFFRVNISPRNAQLMLRSLPPLVKRKVYDIHIEEFLEGARVFPPKFRRFAPYNEFFEAYCCDAVIGDSDLFLAMTTFIRQYSFIFNGEMRLPLAGSPLVEAVSAILRLPPKTQHEKEVHALTQLLNLSTDLASLAIVSGKTLSKNDLRFLRKFIFWVRSLTSVGSPGTELEFAL